MGLETAAEALEGKILGSPESDFVVAEWTDPGGPTGGPPRTISPLHVHHSDDEAWYVLEGELCVQRGEEVVTAKAGSGVYVPRGTPHTFWNPGPGPTRYLLVMTSRIHRLITRLHEPGRTESPKELFRACDSELL